VIQGRKASGLNEAAGLPKNKSLSPSSVLEAGFFIFCTRAGKEGSMQNSIMSRAVALGRRKKSTAMLPKAWRHALVLLVALWAGVVLAAEPTTPPGGAAPKIQGAAADRKNLPPRPEYVTAWPRKVEVAKPDPVLGDKPFQEIWAYNKAFAKRFKNLSPEGATEDFSPGAYALVFRVYKMVLWTHVKGYPEQYTCEYDLYFDNSVHIPLSDKPLKVIQRPPGVTMSYLRLEPVNESDRQALTNAKATPFEPQQWPAVFADGPLDGRFATFGFAYYPDLAPGLAMVRLTGILNRTLAPKAEGTHYWLSLLGKHPYREGSGGRALSGSYMRGIRGSFNPGPVPDKEGYFRMPEAFYHAVLPKVTLAKALNDCIGLRHASTLPNKASVEEWTEVFAACKDMEQNGTIYNVRGKRVIEGLSNLGF
jgi:hypothetical protein